MFLKLLLEIPRKEAGSKRVCVTCRANEGSGRGWGEPVQIEQDVLLTDPCAFPSAQFIAFTLQCLCGGSLPVYLCIPYSWTISLQQYFAHPPSCCCHFSLQLWNLASLFFSTLCWNLITLSISFDAAGSCTLVFFFTPWFAILFQCFW